MYSKYPVHLEELIAVKFPLKGNELKQNLNSSHHFSVFAGILFLSCQQITTFEIFLLISYVINIQVKY